MNSSNSQGGRRPMSEINITPLVDVMLVLLIIFMVAAPMMQQGLEVNLPEVESTGLSTNDKPFVLTIKKSGKVYIEKVNVPIKNLRIKLKAIFKSRKNKQVYIKADKKSYYENVAKTMGEVRAAGITNISLITLPIGNK
jgi:biopolymer transport protein TolR